MRRDGFLLGAIATGSQVLILRELISSLQGDELFIGTALCGWLLWGALGAYFGGKKPSAASSSGLFALAAIILPPIIIAARLSPLLVTGTIGETISFSYATLLSFIVALPSAFVCGCLFAAIVRRGGDDSTSMLRVYYSEGVGAFLAGALVSFLTSNNISTLSTTGVISCGFLAALSLRSEISPRIKIVGAVVGAGAALAFMTIGPRIDRAIDDFKYTPYEVMASFDTPYGHQTVLQRGGARVLLTDNMVESAEGDVQTAENLLLPPLAYVPEARNILIFGQVNLTLPPVLDSLPDLMITEVDARPPLRLPIREFNSGDVYFRYVQNDPVAFLRKAAPRSFDVVIFSLDESGSYRGLRLMTGRALADVRRVLKPHGVLHIVTPYDSDRYVSHDDEQLLSSIRATIETVFPGVIVWPGSSTLFLAGDSSLANLQPDSIVARLSRLNYPPQFLNEYYLSDRLSKWQVERIEKATRRSSEVNSPERPSLANLQIVRRSSAFSVDRWLEGVLGHRGILLIAMICVAVSLIGFSALNRRKRRFALGLYFTAGLVSLNLELVSFYVYQSYVGILYSHLSLLVGSFMLGLSTGTWAMTVKKSGRIAPGALALMAATTLVFMATCFKIPQELALPYHAAFQFIVAFCTGALFVAATRLYFVEPTSRGGIGYAVELTGSSLGALVTMPLLLPAVGLNWLLAAVALLTGLQLICTLIGARSSTRA